MAGHSKFANIKFRKEANDNKRTKLFTKLSRQIIVAAKKGQPDPSLNSALKTSISIARSFNMPKDKIEKAIATACGENKGNDYEEMRYECHALYGVMIIIQALTNNKNRTASEIRSTLSKFGGNLGITGSASYMFQNIGGILYQQSNEIYEYTAGLEIIDIETQETNYFISCEPKNFGKILNDLTKKFNDPIHARIMWQANNPIELNKSKSEKINTLLSVLEENDDVQYIDTNIKKSFINNENSSN